MTSPKKAIPKIDYGIILTLILMTLASLIAIYSAQSTGQYVSKFCKAASDVVCDWYHCNHRRNPI